tara:strand:- start:135 stop:395 length:261 start_codon:yes stop_codon:yes gene_type:complete
VTLHKRLGRLEGLRGGAERGPSIILVCDALTGEPSAALLIGGGCLTREAGESAEAFTDRATAGAAMVLNLPDNRREAQPLTAACDS